MTLGRERALLNEVKRLTKRKEFAQVKQAVKVTPSARPANPRPALSEIDAAEVNLRIADIRSSDLSYEPLEVPGQAPVPRLASKLDRVLFSPGVHFLKDPRTNVYNFDPRLEKIMSITDFDFSKIAPYVPAGRDSKLAELARDNDKKYTGSTSSLTSALTQLHHALSHMRPPQVLNLPKYFSPKLTTFSATQRAPTSLWLMHNPETETYSVNAAGEQQEIILTLLGHAMETMLVTESGEFAKYSKQHPEQPPPQPEGSTYNYTKSGKFLMRSQLDCYDPRLPGTGMFDLKTRACCAIRHDIDYAQIMNGSDYQILKVSGEYESFSREFYEMVRSTMFKYSLQARIGRMDGIFVAYHNVRQLFGFEYLPLSEIDKIYHTAHLVMQHDSKRAPDLNDEDSVDLDRRLESAASLIADAEFKISISLLSELFDALHSQIEGSAGSDLNILLHCDLPGSLVVFARTGDAKSGAGDNLLSVDTSIVGFHEGLYGFRVNLRSSVNGRNVPVSKYPSLSAPEDLWRVSATMTLIPEDELAAAFKDTRSQYVSQVLTSEPRTDGELGAEELSSLLTKLPEASDFQALLRKLDQQGAEYRVWDAERPKIELLNELS